MAIIGEAEGKRPSLAATAETDRALFDLLKGILADLLADPGLSDTLDEWFQEGFAPYRSQEEFKNWGEYYDYIRKFDIRSLNAETVRSFEECEIANFLYLNGIAYEYEAAYEHDLATSEKRQYKPDFHLPEHGIYIEHFGIDAAGNTAPFIDRGEYWRGIEWKRGVHKRYGTVLVETFSHEQTDGRLLRNLTEKLEARGVAFSPIPREEVFAALDRQGRIDPLTRLVATFLQHFKGSRLSFEDIAERADAHRDRKRAEAFLAVFRRIFERYEAALADAGEIDFHDMINRATDLVEEGRYRSPFGYILVDEFQDISPSRARLLKALLDSAPGSQLFSVGDDWQAIYRFGGSDIAVMREFGDRFGPFERIDLATTFRCADRIASVATEFVLRNPAQIRKTVRTTRKADRPAVFVGLPGEQELSLLKEALDRIAEDALRHDGTSEVLILGRYRHLRPLSRLLELPGLRLHEKLADIEKRARIGTGPCEIAAAWATLTPCPSSDARTLSFLDMLNPVCVAAVRLILLTGCRPGEIRRLSWCEVKPDRLTLIDAKTGPRHVLLGEAARELLNGLAETASGEWVFPGKDRDEPLNKNDLYQFWTKARDGAGIVADARLHDLRHAHASHAVMNGESLRVAGRLLGHRRASMTNRYVHFDDATLSDAAERVAIAIDFRLRYSDLESKRIVG